MRRLLSTFGFIAALLCPWTALAQNGPSSCTTSSQNLWVRDQLNTYYYWYQNLPANVNPTNYSSPEAYLDAVRYRPIDNSYSFITSAAVSDAFYSDSQFVGYGFGYQVSGTDIRVLQVYDSSPASEVGLSRGDRILTVNGQSVASLVTSNTIGSAFGAAEIGVVTNIEWETLAGTRRAGSMTKRLVTIPTVSLTRVVDFNGRKVGYLFFRNFVQPSIAALDDAFAALKAAGANELVLDLRYNGGGQVNVAVHLASLIGGARTSGQVMFNQIHNDKIGPRYNETTRFSSEAQALNLERLFVIATRSTASASELIINSLRPYMPVVVIGDATYGKPVGQYGFRFCDKILYPVAFSLKNANMEGDFYDGIPPTCVATDDYLRQLGDAGEPSFAEALAYLRTGACTVRSATELHALRVRPPVFLPTGWAAILNAQ